MPVSDLSINLSESAVGSAEYSDLVLSNGDLVVTSDVNPNGTDVTQQFITTRLRLFLGEFFLDTSDGVPWYQQIFVKGADAADIDGLVKDRILQTPGVQALMSYSSTQDRANRSMSVRFTVRTATGNTVSSSVAVSA